MIYEGDVLEQLRLMPDESVQCCVTSPPYWGLRDYARCECDEGSNIFDPNCGRCEGTGRLPWFDEQIGLEETFDQYMDKIVAVFDHVYRILKNDGVMWLNLGDGFTSADMKVEGLKSKQLIGLPWRVALELQARGWFLRSDIIWQKPNPMPSSISDRVTPSHEYIFLFAKSEKYYYDADAIKTKALPYKKPGKNNSVDNPRTPKRKKKQDATGKASYVAFNERYKPNGYSNRRSVWCISSQTNSGAHVAAFPEMIPKLCILAGSKRGDTILDPFFGSGTTGLVAQKEGREWIGIELNPEYVELAKKRTAFKQESLEL